MLIKLLKPSARYPYTISNNQNITWNYPAPNTGHHQDNYIFGNPYQPSSLTVTGWGVNPTHHHRRTFTTKNPGGTPSTTRLLRHSCHGSPIRMAMLQIGGRNMEAVQHLAVLPLTDLMGLKSVRAMRWDQLGSWKHSTWNWTFKLVIIHDYSPGNPICISTGLPIQNHLGSVFAKQNPMQNICINEAIFYFEKMHHQKSGWWFQPLWKILWPKWESFPSRDEHKKYLKPPPRNALLSDFGIFWVGFSLPSKQTNPVSIRSSKYQSPVCLSGSPQVSDCPHGPNQPKNVEQEHKRDWYLQWRGPLRCKEITVYCVPHPFFSSIPIVCVCSLT